MLLLAFGIIQLVISGLSAQSCSMSCSNGGTCRFDQNGGQWCDCTSNWTGVLCDLKSDQIPFIWTPDEICQMNYGKDYAALRFPGIIMLDCNMISCYSTSFINYAMLITAPNTKGTVCASSSMCMMGICVRTRKAPTPMMLDDMIGNQTCFNYLSKGNFSYARSFCMDPVTFARCPVSCQKFTLFGVCQDTKPACQSLSNFCNSTFPGLNNTVRNVCPYSCNNCPDTPLRCSNTSSICLNGGTCQNVTVAAGSKFAFRCLCPTGFSGDVCEIPNPCATVVCPTGKTCRRLGTYATMCV